ncbi:MAG TPA: hypothetical protein VN643_22415 [Pyrinomonadaceae bacterium]|nr:hypothetical protein [Pyrinomonadaceae bacterium]
MRPLITSLVFFGCLVAGQQSLTKPANIAVAIPVASATETNQRIKKVLIASNRLWILYLNGKLSSLDLKGGDPQEVAPDKFVFDIYRSFANQLYCLGSVSEASTQLSVWQKTDNAWSPIGKIERGRQNWVLGLREYRDSLLILTQNRIYIQKGLADWRSVALKGELKASYQTPFAVTDTGLVYVGVNLGEWGGGLLQASIETGLVTKIERRDTPKLCDGPLNSDCDPVTGVIRDPENSACVLASIGLRHFLERGRLLRVCDKTVSVVFEKSYDDESVNTKKEVMGTEAIFDLVAGSEDYWAVTGRGIYHFKAGTEPTFQTVPALVRRSGISMSDAIPNIIVVATDINWAMSVSGYTPLIAVKN